MLFEAFEDGRMRVAVAVLKPIGDQGEGGVDRVDELRCAGGAAAVMCDLENVGARISLAASISRSMGRSTSPLRRNARPPYATRRTRESLFFGVSAGR